MDKCLSIIIRPPKECSQRFQNHGEGSCLLVYYCPLVLCEPLFEAVILIVSVPRQEALSSAVSEKDAHLAWLEVTGEGNIHTRGALDRLRRERRDLLHRMKEEVCSRDSNKGSQRFHNQGEGPCLVKSAFSVIVKSSRTFL